MRFLFQEKAATWHQSSPGVEQPYAPQDQKAAGRYDFQQLGDEHEVGRIPDLLDDDTGKYTSKEGLKAV